MKKFRLTLITENQKSLSKGKKFAELICETLNCKNRFEISKYNKFINSYKIEIIGEITDSNNSISESIELTDRICSPWNINFNRTSNEVELIFNQSELSNYRNENFNTLNWANFEIE
jgi:predicted GNAT superfamily acetyltransferase